MPASPAEPIHTHGNAQRRQELQCKRFHLHASSQCQLSKLTTSMLKRITVHRCSGLLKSTQAFLRIFSPLYQGWQALVLNTSGNVAVVSMGNSALSFCSKLHPGLTALHRSTVQAYHRPSNCLQSSRHDAVMIMPSGHSIGMEASNIIVAIALASVSPTAASDAPQLASPVHAESQTSYMT